MDFDAFQKFVANNIDWFRGRHPETPESIAQYEAKLGRSFPRSIKWLLTTHGYWHATGIPGLEGSVELTLKCRESIALPDRYIILDDRGDAGVVVLDTAITDSHGEMHIHYVDIWALYNLDGGELRPDIVYESYGDYVVDELKTEREIIDPEHVVYDPRDYGD